MVTGQLVYSVNSAFTPSAMSFTNASASSFVPFGNSNCQSTSFSEKAFITGPPFMSAICITDRPSNKGLICQELSRFKALTRSSMAMTLAAKSAALLLTNCPLPLSSERHGPAAPKEVAANACRGDPPPMALVPPPL